MARPRGGDWLADEMRALSEAGADILVSALTTDEANELDLARERTAAEAAGITFVHLPTPDRATPDPVAFRKLVGDLTEHLDRGEHVVIHCRMGIGRSSMLAAALLMAEGVDPGGAWSTLREARGLDVPDTPEQRAWVEAVMISR